MSHPNSKVSDWDTKYERLKELTRWKRVCIDPRRVRDNINTPQVPVT